MSKAQLKSALKLPGLAVILAVHLASSVFAATGAATVTVSSAVVGKGPRYVGYNYGHFMPGSNTGAWVERSGVNCFRVWANPSYYEPTDDIAPYGDGVTDQASFIARRAALRANPENTSYINWPVWNNRFQNFVQTGTNSCTLNYMLGELKALGVAIDVEIDGRGYNLPGTWADRWEWWQLHYAMGYHMAKNYDVSMFETCNEPDQNGSPVTEPEYVEWTKFADDALRSAVLDVNTSLGKHLTPLIVAPTLKTFNNVDTYGKDKLALMRTDCLGNAVGSNTWDVYSPHQYNATASTFATQISTLQTSVPAYNPTGQMLPIFYTEFNRYNTSTWETLSSSISLDAPAQFTDIAAILDTTMVNGVWGMICFKFSETYSSTFGKYRTGYHYVQDDGVNNITGAKKGVDVVKYFTKAFGGQKDRLQTTVGGSVSGYTAYSAVDTTSGVYRIYCNNDSSTVDAVTTFTLSGLTVTANSTVTVEEVSANHQGEIVSLIPLPASGVFALTQPAQSVWLVTIPKGALQSAMTLLPSADAQVQSGVNDTTNFGSAQTMIVKMNQSNADVNRLSYLKFDLSSLPIGANLRRAILQLDGYNPVDSTVINVDVYGSLNDSWAENTITWATSPDHDGTSISTTITNQGTSAFPLGNITFNDTDQVQRLDVTDFTAKQFTGDKVVSFILSRPERFDGDNADSGRHANIGTRENTTTSRRPTLLLIYGPATAPVAVSRLRIE